ncbi:MAG: hypothetical protein M3Q61_04895, partial [Chloroflexota bacterium]|nr:hypothetical protein [Chloroflexota bacterium]
MKDPLANLREADAADDVPEWAADLPKVDLDSYFELPGMPAALRRLVGELLYRKQAAPPPNTRSWRGRYPSVKMRRVLHWGSRNYELPMIVALERSRDCVAYFTQPRLLKLSARQADGSTSTYRHRPDALGLFLGADVQGSACIRSKWIEAKSETDLRREPEKFVLDAQGRWTHPAASEMVLTNYGSEYEIWNPSSLDPTVISNWMFLGPYLDKILDVPVELRRQAIAMLRRYPALDLMSLRQRVEGLSPDHGYALIADGTLCFPIDRQDLGHPERLTLFADPVFTEAALALPMRDRPGTRRELVLAEGVRLRWGQKDYYVLNVSGDHVTCQVDGEILPPIKRASLTQLAERGDLEQLDAPKDSLAAVLAEIGTAAEYKNTRDRVVRA